MWGRKWAEGGHWMGTSGPLPCRVYWVDEYVTEGRVAVTRTLEVHVLCRVVDCDLEDGTQGRFLRCRRSSPLPRCPPTTHCAKWERHRAQHFIVSSNAEPRPQGSVDVASLGHCAKHRSFRHRVTRRRETLHIRWWQCVELVRPIVLEIL